MVVPMAIGISTMLAVPLGTNPSAEGWVGKEKRFVTAKM